MGVPARQVGCKVVAFDRPGWGLASPPCKNDLEENQLPNPYKFETQVDLLLSYCLEMGFSLVVLVGHDDGARESRNPKHIVRDVLDTVTRLIEHSMTADFIDEVVHETTIAAADAVQENPKPQSNQHSDDRQEAPQVADGYKEEVAQDEKDADRRVPRQRKAKRGTGQVIMDYDQMIISGPTYQSRIQGASDLVPGRGRKKKHIKPMPNMKIAHLMKLPPVGITYGLSGYRSKEIYNPAPLMNLWIKYSQLQPPRDSPLVIQTLLLTARLTSPPRPSSSSAPPPRPVFDQELSDFVCDCTQVLASFILSSSMLTYLSASCVMYMDMKPAEEFYIGFGSQPKPVSLEKKVSMEKYMDNPDNFEFPGAEATMMVTLGNSGTFGGNERSIPSSGFGNCFLPVELEVQRASKRSSSKKFFSSSIQSGSGLAPVAEDIPWDLPEPSFKLKRLSESSPTNDPGILLAR
ncbi:hypothetical protein GIB67_002420 [Kingdonia uniflora]|uniref:AB hydrolase-1 domain-containing protein n=1 Tax=Kingdonia uniflora TaxID=39325 RepID=A0A7J7MP32_9MAGN|nr:hypothetical protein GIB67_002420 [Kingdonia uniflora]